MGGRAARSASVVVDRGAEAVGVCARTVAVFRQRVVSPIFSPPSRRFRSCPPCASGLRSLPGRKSTVTPGVRGHDPTGASSFPCGAWDVVSGAACIAPRLAPAQSCILAGPATRSIGTVLRRAPLGQLHPPREEKKRCPIRREEKARRGSVCTVRGRSSVDGCPSDARRVAPWRAMMHTPQTSPPEGFGAGKQKRRAVDQSGAESSSVRRPRRVSRIFPRICEIRASVRSRMSPISRRVRFSV